MKHRAFSVGPQPRQVTHGIDYHLDDSAERGVRWHLSHKYKQSAMEAPNYPTHINRRRLRVRRNGHATSK